MTEQLPDGTIIEPAVILMDGKWCSPLDFMTRKPMMQIVLPAIEDKNYD